MKFNLIGGSTIGMLFILFIAFKIANIITWSWLWVLSPLWISAVVSIGILLIGLFVMAIIVIIALIKGD